MPYIRLIVYWFGILFFAAVPQYFSFITGHLSHLQIYLAAIFPALLILSICFRYKIMIWLFWMLIFILGMLALVQSPYRGTHRWEILGTIRMNLAVPLVVSTFLMVTAIRSSKYKCIVTALVVLVLIASASFSSALFLVLAVFLSSANLRRASAFQLVVASLLILIFISIVVTPNRLRRLELFEKGTGYQTIQIKRVLSRLNFLSPSRSGFFHLPAKKTDLALLDIMAHNGIAVGVLIVVCYVLIFILLRSFAQNLPPPSKELLEASALFILLSAFFHVLVNLSVLPPFGVPAPFIGTGLSADISYKCILIICFAACFQFYWQSYRDSQRLPQNSDASSRIDSFNECQ